MLSGPRRWRLKTVPTFAKGSYAHRVRLANARRLAKLEAGASVEQSSRGFAFPVPADLRGLPAVGRGCGAGAIRGTRPGDGLFR
jgi:hypothetical protein